jgi:uncharacterized HhH-GPD family protein
VSVLPEPVGAWISTCAPVAIAGHPRSCAGVGASNVRSNQARVAGENTLSGLIRPGYSAPACRARAVSRILGVPEALYFTDDPAACKLLADDPFALLVGFAIDQQVTVPKAFAGPYVLKQRAGTLEPKRLAAMDLVPYFAEKPAIHRFPAAMAERVRELAAVVAEDYGGDASRIWSEAADTQDLRKRIASLPGFGEMKIKSLGALLSKQFGVRAADGLAPGHPTLGDVTSPESLAEYQAGKRAHKAKLRAGNA